MEYIPQNLLVVILGIASSYQDIRHKKVGNRLLLTALALFAVLLASGHANPEPWKMSHVLLNAAIGTVAGAVMWAARVWPAGDAKLFMVFALIVPFHYYSKHFVPYFPAFDILINTFVIAMALLVGMVIKDSILHLLKRGGMGDRDDASLPLRTWQKIVTGFPTFIKSVLLVSVVFFTARMIIDYTMGMGNRFFSQFIILQFAVVFILYRQIFLFLKTRVPIMMCALLLLACLILKFFLLKMDVYFFSIYLLRLIKMALIFMGAIQIVVVFFDYYIKMMQTRTIPVSQLCKGMVLSQQFGESVKAQCGNCEGGMWLRADGLDIGQVQAIQSCFPEDYSAQVVSTYPFAPIIFAGVLSIMILQQSLLHIILMALL